MISRFDIDEGIYRIGTLPHPFAPLDPHRLEPVRVRPSVQTSAALCGDRISAVYLVMGIRSGRRTSGGGRARGRGDPIYAKAEGRADDGRYSQKKLTLLLSASEADIVVDIVSTP